MRWDEIKEIGIGTRSFRGAAYYIYFSKHKTSPTKHSQEIGNLQISNNFIKLSYYGEAIKYIEAYWRKPIKHWDRGKIDLLK